MSKLLLVDGNSIMNRAFYALAGRSMLTAPDGTPTGAVSGFINSVFGVVDEYKPEYMCVLFDLRAPTFRHKMSADYKANRKGMPEELALQMPVIKEILDKAGIARCEYKGYEADDLIGTFSKKASEKGMKVYIFSGDHDDFQLIDENVSVIMPQSGKDKPPRQLYDEAYFTSVYGISPKSFIYVKALMGDNSDNIKGIDKVGEKTALKLISDYKNFDGIFENLDKLTPSLKSKLLGQEEFLEFNLKLCTIVRDVDTGMEISQMHFNEPDDKQGLFDELNRLELRSAIKRFKLTDMTTSDAICNLSGSIGGDLRDELLSDIKEVLSKMKSPTRIEVADLSSKILKSISSDERKPCFGIDFVSVNDKNYAVVAFCDEKVNSYYLDADLLDEALKATPSAMPAAFDFKNVSKVCKNPISSISSVFDTGIAGYVLNKIDGSTPRLDILFERCFVTSYPGRLSEKSGQIDMLSIIDSEPNDEKLLTVALKIYINTCLSILLSKEIEDNGLHKLIYDIEMPLVMTLDRIERNGMHVSSAALDSLHEEFSLRLKEIVDEIYELTGVTFNVSSPKQLSEVLFERLGLKHGKKSKTGSYSTSIEELMRLKGSHPVIDKLIDFRSLSKLDSTYAVGLREKIAEDGRIHTTFTQAMTNTGRLSSTEPNLQNIPVRTIEGSRIREAFTASEGNVLIDGDYSQIELRLLAAMSGDETMTQAFLDGDDIHKRTAMKVFGVDEENVTPKMRSAAKTVNFSIIYGISEYGLSSDLHISYAEAADFIKEYGRQFPGVTGFLDELQKKGEENGYADTMFGRRRVLNELSSQNRNLRNFGLRAAMNTPIQGTAADIIKIAMNRTEQALLREVPQAKLVMQVHDELIAECPKEFADAAKEVMKREMENAVKLSVPLAVDVNIGENWLEAK